MWTPAFMGESQAPVRVGILHSMALYLALSLLLLFFGRLVEFIIVHWHLRIPLAMITALAGLIIATASGLVWRAFRVPSINLLVLFTAWMVVCLPFSFWKMGSIAELKDVWLKSLVVAVVVCAALQTIAHCRKAAYVLALGVSVILIMGMIYGTYEYGRLIIPGGSLSNPNEIANRLTVGLPFCLFVFRNEKKFSLRRFLLLIAFPLFLLMIFRTGSRAGVLALLVLAAAMFLEANITQKLALLCTWMLIVVGVASFVPRDAWIRFTTIFGSSEERPTAFANTTPETNDVAVGYANSSRVARKQLLLRGLQMTLRHPIFGVGVGNFVPAEAHQTQEEGRRAAWHENHNTFLQISSETGIPGLIMYLCALSYCIRSTYSIYRQSRADARLSDINRLAFCLLLSLLCWTMGAFFDSQGYRFDFPMLAGVSGAFVVAARDEMRRRGPAGAPSSGPLARPAPAHV
jgi:O-antigen ligase